MLIWPRLDLRSRSRSGQGRGAFELQKIAENCRKLHFYRYISSAILAWSSKLMVDRGRDSMGPNLQLVGARFSIFLLRKLSHDFKLCRMSILNEFQMAIFPYCVRLRSHGRGRWCIAHTDMTLTWSKVKVKVTDLQKFRKLHFSTSISSAILACSSKLLVDYDSRPTGPSLQLLGARIFQFLPQLAVT